MKPELRISSGASVITVPSGDIGRRTKVEIAPEALLDDCQLKPIENLCQISGSTELQIVPFPVCRE